MNIFVNSVPNDVVMGIDCNSFSLKKNQQFHGIKLISSDVKYHVVHFQHSENGIRYGYWFSTDPNLYLSFSYNPEQEIYIPEFRSDDNARQELELRFKSCQHLMVSYPSEANDTWQTLTSCMKWADIRYWASELSVDTPVVYVDSTMTTSEENHMLRKALANTSNSQRQINVPEQEPTLNYTPIRFKSNEALRADHRTTDFLDKSWYLYHVILAQYHYSSFHSLLGEMQFSFLNSMIFSNYGSSLQWHAIIELICGSSKVSPSQIQKLDHILSSQLNILPQEYADTLLNEEVWTRCLTVSTARDCYHSESLKSTTAAIQKLIPDVFPVAMETAAKLVPEDLEEEEQLENASTFFDSDDEYAPAVASTVFYKVNLSGKTGDYRTDEGV
ncbi:HHL142Cp [Eremothecium sinecaudum]|uniref:HHL142Cp n=1 Tax=Eremothecium sinecaudum TaxID=45286 RepID=A0A0X8HWD1_9SACH|nr:HHL142Cp [Eremothecium sinecaudum]AMD22628.1 HHL142Cp [Eremothecium sinecaudum]